jgi:hypothetical protein
MPSSVKQLVAPSFLTATNTTVLYTVPTGIKTTIIREISINNTDSVTRTFTLSVGAVSTASNIIFDVVPVQAVGAEPLNYSRATVLKTGDTLVGYADSASKVGIMVSGIEYT